MRLSRRTLLETLLKGGIYTAFAGRMAPPYSFPGVKTPAFAQTLAAYLDTLIPADSSPSASQFGIAAQIEAAAPEGSSYRKLLLLGCEWLDSQAETRHGAAFFALTPEQREVIVTEAEHGAPGSIPLVFFQATREDAMSRYYQDPRTWAGMGYQGPPQPLGFPDYTRPPALHKTPQP